MAFVNDNLLTYGLTDYTHESIDFSIYIQPITLTNITSSNTLIAAFTTALAGITLGSVNKIDIGALRQIERPAVFPTDPYAQRESQWLCTYRDNVTGTEATFRVPVALLAGNLKPEVGDPADLTSTAWQAFKTAFEALAVSAAGNAVTLLKAVHVGKNI